MTFASLEARANAAVIRRLSNVTATIALPADVAGETFAGIFDAAYQVIDQASGIQSTAPVLTAADSDFPAALVDALDSGDSVAFEINGCTYSVVEPQPDGTGLTVLRLRK